MQVFWLLGTGAQPHSGDRGQSPFRWLGPTSGAGAPPISAAGLEPHFGNWAQPLFSYWGTALLWVFLAFTRGFLGDSVGHVCGWQGRPGLV